MRIVKAGFSALAAAGFAFALAFVIHFVAADRIARQWLMAEPPSPNTVVMRATSVDVPLWPSLVVAGVVFVGVLWSQVRRTA